jgi:hypothetical protein
VYQPNFTEPSWGTRLAVGGLVLWAHFALIDRLLPARALEGGLQGLAQAPLQLRVVPLEEAPGAQVTPQVPAGRWRRPETGAPSAHAAATPSVIPDITPALAATATATATDGDADADAADAARVTAPTNTHAASRSVTRAPPDAGPGQFRVHVPSSQVLVYELTGQSRDQRVVGSAELHWSHDGRRYEARLIERRPAGLRVQRSVGALSGAGLLPERYSDQPARGGSEQAAHFEHAPMASTPGRIRFSGNQVDVPLQPGAQDRLSVLMQLAALAGGRARTQPGGLVRGERLTLQVATVREAPAWTFQVEGEETLGLPGGDQRTHRLRHAPSAAYEPTLELWLAPALDYLPVRVLLQHPGGDRLDLRWAGADRNAHARPPP